MVSLSCEQLQMLRSAIKEEIPASVRENEAGRYVVERLKTFERLQDFFSPSCRRERCDKLMESLRKTLANTKCTKVVEAEESDAIKTAKELSKKIKREGYSSQEEALFHKQLLASRLAISLEALEGNEGFYDFAFDHHLHQYLRTYGDHLEEESDTHKIKIKSEGRWQYWDDVKEVVQKKGEKEEKKPSQRWVYGPNGLQNKDLYDWKKLEPFKYDDPAKWGNRWLFELCACNEKVPRKNLDHSWIRLYSPKGEIYSVGLYRPEKEGNLGNLETPLRIKKGYLQQPDVSEFWPCDPHAIRVQIDEETFEKIKKQIEKDHEKDAEIFQAIGQNCTQYNNKIAKIAGITLPTGKRIWRLLVPKEIEMGVDSAIEILPPFLVMLVEKIVAFITNFFLVCLGATQIDKQLIEEGSEPVKSHIQSFGELFDPDKATIHHPHTLGDEIYKDVNEWRKKEKERLENTIAEIESKESSFEKNNEIAELRQKIEEIAYQLPSKYKLSSIIAEPIDKEGESNPSKSALSRELPLEN